MRSNIRSESVASLTQKRLHLALPSYSPSRASSHVPSISAGGALSLRSECTTPTIQVSSLQTRTEIPTMLSIRPTPTGAPLVKVQNSIANLTRSKFETT